MKISGMNKPILTIALIAAVVLGTMGLFAPQAQAGCSGGCCVADCLFTCCTGTMSCGPEECKRCTSCECSWGFSDCNDCD